MGVMSDQGKFDMIEVDVSEGPRRADLQAGDLHQHTYCHLNEPSTESARGLRSFWELEWARDIRT